MTIPMTVPVLRVARSSDDLNGLLRFYCDGLGLMALCRFEDHAGFDGIMLGREGAPYHFEFTKKRAYVRAPAPTADDLLVFYYPDVVDWHAALRRMLDAGFVPVPAANP